MISIYTGNVSEGGPGSGGWTALIVDEWGKKSPFSGAEKDATDERMGVKAAVEGLIRTPPGSQVTVYTPSQYVTRNVREGSKPEADKDLWAILDRLVARRSVSWEWVPERGEAPLQEEAAQIARQAAGSKAEAPANGHLLQTVDAESVSSLSHLDEHGEARMVDITDKADSRRVATARGRVVMQPSTLELIRAGQVAKGDVLSVARIAGIMGAKRTAELVPLCHPLLLTDVAVTFELIDADSAVEITATVKTAGKTGAEMEALTAVTISALTVYDMCKAADRRMRVEAVRLLRKSGGKSGNLVLE